MIRLGIVGTGGMARQRCRLFHDRDDAQVVAVCSRSLERAKALAKDVGAVAWDDLETMLPDVDAVVIGVANHAHHGYVAQTFAAGKHVLVEYPLCLDLEHAHALQALSEQTDRVLMVGNTIIHEAMFGYLRAHRSQLGTIASAASRVAFHDPALAGHWYMNTALAGPPLASFHYHHIEYYRHLLGPVEWVLARDESHADANHPGCFSFAGGSLLMSHESGATSCVQWYLSAGGAGCARGWWVTGTKASVTIVSHKADCSLVIWDGGGDGKEDVFVDD